MGMRSGESGKRLIVIDSSVTNSLSSQASPILPFVLGSQ